jgi:hypothetical protein
MSTPYIIPKWLALPKNLCGTALLRIVEGKGVYVTVTRRDTGEEIELPDEGNGAPDDLDRITRYVRAHRYKYVVSRVQDALLDVWQRERLGLMI